MRRRIAALVTKSLLPDSARWRNKCLFALPILVLAGDLFRISRTWKAQKGYEYEWVAGSLSAGFGFSFDGSSQWLFDPTTASDYFTTAWVEPIYPLLYAALFRLFDAHGRLAMLIAQAFFFSLTLVLVYRIGTRCGGAVTGLTGAALLALFPHSHHVVTRDLSNATLAGLLVCASCLCTLWCLNAPSTPRALALGALIGLTALTHASTLLFAPAAAGMLLSTGGWRRRVPWRHALTVLFAAVLTIAPWTARNHSRFAEFVPVRTGLGQNIHMANRAVGMTFLPGSVPGIVRDAPPWRAKGAREGWSMLQDIHRRRELRDFAKDVVEATAPEGYAEFNEARRDKIYLRQSAAFMTDHPVAVIELALLKAVSFFFTKFRYFGLPLAGALAAFALIGACFGVRDSRVRTVALFLLVFSAPYLVSAPYFYRYRYPAEPLIAVLAGIALVRSAAILWPRLAARQRRHP